jgi:hypothetical protein
MHTLSRRAKDMASIQRRRTEPGRSRISPVFPGLGVEVHQVSCGSCRRRCSRCVNLHCAGV